MADSFVTDSELKAHLGPIKSDISEIKSDVKSLLRKDAGRVAVNNAFWKVTGIAATLCCGLVVGIFH